MDRNISLSVILQIIKMSCEYFYSSKPDMLSFIIGIYCGRYRSIVLRLRFVMDIKSNSVLWYFGRKYPTIRQVLSSLLVVKLLQIDISTFSMAIS